MKRLFLLLLVVATGSQTVRAQDDLFGTTDNVKPKRHGFIIGINGNFDIPAGDMSDRFGLSYRIGPSLLYKTENNWVFGVKGDFIFGGDVKEDSLLRNLRDETGGFLDKNGLRVGLAINERGYTVGLQAGRIFPVFRKNTDNGILLLTGAGFIQHKITLYNRDNDIPQIKDDYRKGYDRLTNGWYLEQFAGFNHLSSKSIVHYYIGFNITAGFTQGRRDYLIDVMRPGNESRVDILFGIRGGWYIPMFRSKSQEFYFE